MYSTIFLVVSSLRAPDTFDSKTKSRIVVMSQLQAETKKKA